MTSAKNQSIYVLGINEASCASAAILHNGRILAAASEERFTGIKNQWGFPKKAIDFCCQFAGIKSSDLNLVVLSYLDPYPHFTFNKAQERMEFAPNILKSLRDHAPGLEYKLPALNAVTDLGRAAYYQFYQGPNQRLQQLEIAQALGVSTSQIIRIDHHLCHAYSGFYANPDFKVKKTLVLTCDGAGDGNSASVYLVEDGYFKLISKTAHSSSLGLLYASVTSFLGLKPHEDEFKVMGLAAYTNRSDYLSIYEKLKKLIWVEGLVFKTALPSRHYNFYLRDNFTSVRFDHLAGALQALTEDLICEWVSNAIKKLKVNDLIFSGGVFQNVKLNKAITNLKLTNKIFFMPSPGDETNCFGAAYYGYQRLCQDKGITCEIEPLQNLYLGPQYSQTQIDQALKKYPQLIIKKPKELAKTVAKLIAEGSVVARFAGRMEMGSRGLGNRSILADPRNVRIVEKINRLIKLRDFWMPFAPTILDESASKYIRDPKKLEAPFMILTFATTEPGKTSLPAALHRYDQTTRPQLLKTEVNLPYYQIIKEFEKLTGVGAVLNTSFNLHGRPIVCTPINALETFVKSGLEYLILEDYLITK